MKKQNKVESRIVSPKFLNGRERRGTQAGRFSCLVTNVTESISEAVGTSW